MKEIVCNECSEKFSVYGKRSLIAKFCSMKCYISNRWDNGKSCLECGKDIIGKRFCTDECRISYWNKRASAYGEKRRKKYWKEKIAILDSLGGKCVQCGNSDVRVLDLDHIDSSKKQYKSEYRSAKTPLRLRLWREEIKNLQILCANCHRIKTHEEQWKTQGMFQA